MLENGSDKYITLSERIGNHFPRLVPSEMLEASKVSTGTFESVIAAVAMADYISHAYGLIFTAEEALQLSDIEKLHLQKSLLRLTTNTASRNRLKINPESTDYLKNSDEDIFSHELEHIKKHGEYVNINLASVKIAYYLSVNPSRQIDLSFRTRIPETELRLSPMQIIWVKLAPRFPSPSDYWSISEMMRLSDKKEITDIRNELELEINRKPNSEGKVTILRKLKSLV